MAAIDNQVVGAAIDARVRAFYEEHPYPLPVHDLSGYAEAWTDERRRHDAHLLWPAEAYRPDRTILVAGCGTSQAAKVAMRWPQARVTGIDFSAASLDATAKLKRRHGLDNLDLLRLSVEGARELAGHFDLVVCTGVLHHLPDPVVGLRALRDVLAPNGAMHLMVYAPYGRTGIYMLQEYCRRLGVGSSRSEIRDLAADISAVPPDHPVMPLLRNMPDFRNEAGLADALLNPRDRAYSVPQLFDLLANANLGFRRWLRQAPYLPTCGVLTRSPHAGKFKLLSQAEQFAAVELFRGSMVLHSLIACRIERPRADEIRFAGEDWHNYVPIRVPDTIVVEERLPPPAAAVLINRNHTYTDIYLPIDAQQKTLFDLIDGTSSIGQLAPDKHLHSIARTLFEQLWQYDHVVFDNSRTPRDG